MDKTLNDQRKARWARAFSDEHIEESSHDSNLRATIVIEHLIQASDVSHTMQHWHVYRKWNERLFHEVYKAYLCGRIDTDPSESWYKGEIVSTGLKDQFTSLVRIFVSYRIVFFVFCLGFL